MSEFKKKAVLFLSTVLMSGALFLSVQTKQRAIAYQFTSIQSETDSTRHRQLLWAYNADSVAHENGDVVVWYDGTNDGLEFSTTTTANNGLVAGVVAPKTVAATSWGFIQTHGYHSAITIGVANSAGDALVTSTTGEAAGVYSVAQATGTASNQSNTFGVLGVALEATTSSTTVKGFILR